MKRNQEYAMLSEMLNNGYDFSYKRVSIFNVENVIGKKYQLFIERGDSTLYKDMSEAIKAFLNTKRKMYPRGNV